MGKWIITLLLSVALFAPSEAYTQEEPKNEHFEKASKKRKKDAKEAEKEIIKNHEKIQTKETRKRMKKTKRKSKRIKNGKPAEPFYKRWFRKS